MLTLLLCQSKTVKYDIYVKIKVTTSEHSKIATLKNKLFIKIKSS